MKNARSFDRMVRDYLNELEARERLTHRDSSDHISDTGNPHDVNHSQLPDVDGGVADNPHGNVKWRGEWVGGTQYRQHDMSQEDGWLMVANKDTQDHAAPQKEGEPFYAYTGDNLVDSIVTARQVVFGQRYTPAQDIWVAGYRVYTVAGNHYEIVTVEDPDGAAQATFINSFIANSTGWREFGVVPHILPSGVDFQLLVITNEPDPTPTTWQGDWDYQKPNNGTVPTTGQITHAAREAGILRVHKTDSLSGDRGAELLALEIGDRVLLDSIEWSIQSITDNTTWVAIGIAPAAQESVTGVNTFTFETTAEVPITIQVDTDFWLTVAVVSGEFVEDGSWEDVVEDDNAYGADLLIQEATVSPDWDFANLVGSGGSGSSSELPPGVSLESGFENRTDSTISFVDGTRTFTIAPVADEFRFYEKGNLFTKVAAESIVIPDVSGSHLVYYDGGVLKSSPTFVEEMITLYTLVAVISWKAGGTARIFFGDERHGHVMDSSTHRYNHSTFGARYGEGLALVNMSVDGSGDDATDAQFGVANGVIWDEDIEHIIEDGSPQTLAAPAEIPIYYRSGSDWVVLPSTAYPVATTGSGRAAYNEFLNPGWQISEVNNNDFCLMHYYATNSLDDPVIAIMGQDTYPTAASAQDGAESELRILAFGDLIKISPEFVPIATCIFQTANGYLNAVKSKIISTADGENYIDWRYSAGGSSGGISTEDPDAIHDNVAGEIQAVTEKTTPVANDLLLGEDSENSYAKVGIKIGNLPGGGSGGGGLTPVFVSANYTASAGELVMCDSSGGVFNVTLPASPSDADNVMVIDYANACRANPVTILPGSGDTVDQGQAIFVIDQNMGQANLAYELTDTDWRTGMSGTPELMNVDDYTSGAKRLFLKPHSDLVATSASEALKRGPATYYGYNAFTQSDSTTANAFSWFTLLPKNYDPTRGIRFRFIWESASTSTGDIEFDLVSNPAIGDGDPFDSTNTPDTLYSAGPGATLSIVVSPWSIVFYPTGWTYGDMVNFWFRRDGSSALDTYSGTAYLIGVEAEYFTNAPTED